jgi:hypothetical protein
MEYNQWRMYQAWKEYVIEESKKARMHKQHKEQNTQKGD